MHATICHRLDDVPADDWNRIAGSDNPFTRHEFLVALEHHDCVGETFGWFPHHILIHEKQELVAASPVYIKNNSYGEFVFDWAWADAYQRSGLNYYPKLVCGIPYTPATGPRVLTGANADPALTERVMQVALELAHASESSSIHWLFTDSDTTRQFETGGWFRRTGEQYHWHNHGYADFDAFLAALTQKKRKQIRKERKRAQGAGLELSLERGNSLSESDWDTFAQLYTDTFDRKWGHATLNAGFFKEIAGTMGDKVLLALARRDGDIIAGAINFIGLDTLYGRHWGAFEQVPDLHFELCYYQTIDYCIQHGLQRFEAGAQGEHKLARGFVPVPTYSAHWVKDARFDKLIRQYCADETEAMQAHMAELSASRSPYCEAVRSESLELNAE